MLDPQELQQLIKRAKRGPLVSQGVPVAIGRHELERLLPHRSPMLLVDTVDLVDREARAVRGARLLRPDDLGFAGHFPGEPIYPGVLVIETMGQLALMLPHFALDDRLDVPDGHTPRRVRATHIHHAAFIAPFHPGDVMTLHAGIVHADYTMVAVGQAWRGDQLAAFAVCEVFIDE